MLTVAFVARCMATDNLHHIANLSEPNAESLALLNAQPNAGTGTGDEDSLRSGDIHTGTGSKDKFSVSCTGTHSFSPLFSDSCTASGK